MPITKTELMQMSRTELDELYKNSSIGAMPKGDSQGFAVIAPGTFLQKFWHFSSG